MKKNRPVIVIVCLLALIVTTASPRRSTAQDLVLDIANLAQNILQVLYFIEEIAILQEKLEYWRENMEKLEALYDALQDIDSLEDFLQVHDRWQEIVDEVYDMVAAYSEPVEPEAATETDQEQLETIDVSVSKMQQTVHDSQANIESELTDIDTLRKKLRTGVGDKRLQQLQGELAAKIAEQLAKLRQENALMAESLVLQNKYQLQQHTAQRALHDQVTERPDWLGGAYAPVDIRYP